jgi:hypothetical protein
VHTPTRSTEVIRDIVSVTDIRSGIRVDAKIALAFLKRYPTPADARGLGERRLAALLGRHGYTRRRPARKLLGRLRAGASGRARKLETKSHRAMSPASGSGESHPSGQL